MTPANDLVTIEYDRHKAEVIRTVAAKLSASGIPGAASELDASYNEAWHALYLALADGEEVENRVGYLVTVTHRRALNEFRAMKVSRRADAEAVEEIGVELDIDSQLDAEIQLRHIREGFRSKLSSRELEAATLCHLYGYTRPEAAEAMGVRPKRMEKIMDRASARISSVVETVRSGEHCAELESTVRAFALGVLDPDGEKYRLACDHLEHCPACRREVWTERGLAAIGPPLPAAFLLLAGGSGVAGGAAGGIALTAGKGGGAAKGAAGIGKGASAGRKAAIAGSAVAAVAVVAVGGALATGTIGGSGSGDGQDATVASAGGGGGSGAGSGASAESASARSMARKAARLAASRKAARKARARARAAATKRRAARAAAAAAAAEAAVTYTPEPVYIPPPVVEVEPVEPEPTKPEPEKPDPKPTRPDPPAETKPTTDAGEEFGLR